MTMLINKELPADPPAYSPSSSTSTFPESPLTHGFPMGYFVIKHVATTRVLDVGANSGADETDVLLWPEKEASLVLDLRDSAADNQIFFIDHTGALCSVESGHAIDVQEGKLVLRHRRPYTSPFPNAYSHPLPVFSYDMKTGIIRVTFACDPSYPSGPSVDGEDQAWRSKDYILTSVPIRAAPSLAQRTSEFFFSAASQLSILPSRTGEEFEVPHDEVLDADRAEDENVDDDDSAEKWRHVKVAGLPLGWNEKGAGAGGKRDRDRRRWAVLPLLKAKAHRSP